MKTPRAVSCNYCRKSEIIHIVELKSCSVCKLVSYCNASCQEEDWELHQHDCRPSDDLVDCEGACVPDLLRRSAGLAGLASFPKHVLHCTQQQESIKGFLQEAFDRGVRHGSLSSTQDALSDAKLRRIGRKLESERKTLRQTAIESEPERSLRQRQWISSHLQLCKFFDHVTLALDKPQKQNTSWLQLAEMNEYKLDYWYGAPAHIRGSSAFVRRHRTKAFSLESTEEAFWALNHHVWLVHFSQYQHDTEEFMRREICERLRLTVTVRMTDGEMIGREDQRPMMAAALDEAERQAMRLLRFVMLDFAIRCQDTQEHDDSEQKSDSEPHDDQESDGEEHGKQAFDKARQAAEDVLYVLRLLNIIKRPSAIGAVFREFFSHAEFAMRVLQTYKGKHISQAFMEFVNTGIDGFRLLPQFLQTFCSVDTKTDVRRDVIVKNYVAPAIMSASFELVFSEEERAALREIAEKLAEGRMPLDKPNKTALRRIIHVLKRLDAEWASSGLGDVPNTYTVDCVDRVIWYLRMWKIYELRTAETDPRTSVRLSFALMAAHLLERTANIFQRFMHKTWSEDAISAARDSDSLEAAVQMRIDASQEPVRLISTVPGMKFLQADTAEAVYSGHLSSSDVNFQPSILPEAAEFLRSRSVADAIDQDSEATEEKKIDDTFDVCMNPVCGDATIFNLIAMYGFQLPSKLTLRRLKRCDGCTAAWYCSDRCQEQDRDRHRQDCKSVSSD